MLKCAAAAQAPDEVEAAKLEAEEVAEAVEELKELSAEQVRLFLIIRQGSSLQ